MRFSCPHRRPLGLLLSSILLIAPMPFSRAADSAAVATGMAVSVVKAKSACFVDNLQLNGTIIPREEILVRPNVEGLQLASILVDDGATVSVGQALAQLTRPGWMPGTPTKVTITAPAKGILVRRQLALGMPASSRGAPMFSIIRDGELEFEAEIPQIALAKVKTGQAARIETLSGDVFSGIVRSILPEIDPLTQLGHARFEVRGAQGIVPGAFATASIDLEKSCGTAVPLASILYGPEGSVVQVVRNDKVETRKVKVGLLDGKDAEILAGLNAGDTVVARAGSFLREGEVVRPAP
ncbi:efflux transporter periplasmic adaptor subunit [Beijerinckiaceae bacterium]|nr:efflux transporter periplasmic adaptor subunit [Beijerinckiaceae bacterium]